MKIFNKVIEAFVNTKSLEEKIFYFFNPLFILMFLVSTIISALEGAKPITITVMAICTLAHTVIYVICSYLKKYSLGFVLVTIFVSYIIMPLILFVYGGIDNAVPCMMLATIIMLSICIDRKCRPVYLITTIVVNSGAIYLSFVHPEYVISVSENIRTFNYIFFFVLCSVFSMLGCWFVIDTTAKYNTILETHMDHNIANDLLNHDGKFLSGKQNVAVLFIDICSFTSSTENMSIDMAKKYINRFFTICDTYISKYDGVFDKYIGDCVMVYWPDDGSNVSLKACKMAIEINKELEKHCDEYLNEFGFKLQAACGIDYGEVIVGEIGLDERKNFTIIGDTVNTASRLEGFGEANDIVVSKRIVEYIEGSLQYTQQSTAKLKGKKDPVDIYKIIY